MPRMKSADGVTVFLLSGSLPLLLVLLALLLEFPPIAKLQLTGAEVEGLVAAHLAVVLSFMGWRYFVEGVGGRAAGRAGEVTKLVAFLLTKCAALLLFVFLLTRGGLQQGLILLAVLAFFLLGGCIGLVACRSRISAL